WFMCGGRQRRAAEKCVRELARQARAFAQPKRRQLLQADVLKCGDEVFQLIDSEALAEQLYQENEDLANGRTDESQAQVRERLLAPLTEEMQRLRRKILEAIAEDRAALAFHLGEMIGWGEYHPSVYRFLDKDERSRKGSSRNA